MTDSPMQNQQNFFNLQDYGEMVDENNDDHAELDVMRRLRSILERSQENPEVVGELIYCIGTLEEIFEVHREQTREAIEVVRDAAGVLQERAN